MSLSGCWSLLHCWTAFSWRARRSVSEASWSSEAASCGLLVSLGAMRAARRSMTPLQNMGSVSGRCSWRAM